MSTVFTHYFSGNALYKVNAFASLTGLLISITSAFILIPRYGITGASITSCFGYLSSGIFTIIAFKRKMNSSEISLFPTVNDMKELIKGLKNI
jgi:O-antigen/teichoic acid export membrane protein